MKTSDEWTTWIIDYMQKHPVKNMEQARKQIFHIVEEIRADSTVVLPPAANDAPSAR